MKSKAQSPRPQIGGKEHPKPWNIQGMCQFLVLCLHLQELVALTGPLAPSQTQLLISTFLPVFFSASVLSLFFHFPFHLPMTAPPACMWKYGTCQSVS